MVVSIAALQDGTKRKCASVKSETGVMGRVVGEFARWKVRNTAIERRDLVRHPVPLMPEFQRSIRLLGRRPTTQQFIDTIIKKYGTHLLISATLGGEEALTMYMDKSHLDRKSGNATQSVEALHQLASSYFVDRDGTMRRLHEIQISTGAIKVTETRTGPLGCNSYDNLDSVSSVLLQSTESKLHLQELFNKREPTLDKSTCHEASEEAILFIKVKENGGMGHNDGNDACEKAFDHECTFKHR
ncbi:BMP/retinoic acid-inducible neural-specific protein 1-like [Talpa occidentalis]|uniref:BMP/retinoic acid-inducible neural-specific protein 1-like n=1 Tax=Talpa occidentalis TaxID=50954 RepID=UPI00188E9904|nr:BMP/retinoic acid-inducible neural-specific protein 1-like [Talpa occidentalis]